MFVLGYNVLIQVTSYSKFQVPSYSTNVLNDGFLKLDCIRGTFLERVQHNLSPLLQTEDSPII